MSTLSEDVKEETAKLLLIEKGFTLVITQGIVGTRKEIIRPVNHMHFTDDVIDAIQNLRNVDWIF